MLPAFLNTKRSPGMASKIVSSGARLSAQPMIAVCGAWPSFTKAVLRKALRTHEVARRERQRFRNGKM